MTKTETAAPDPAGASGFDLDLDVSITCPLWAEVLPGAAELSDVAAGGAFLITPPGGVPHPGGAGKTRTEASIVLADDAFVRGLNRDYRDLDEPTNVLSFPASEPDDDVAAPPPGAPRLLGDIVVGYETTVGEANRQGKTLGDNLCHLVVHGMLHLLGHDHQTPAVADTMERLEIEILAGLDIANPYEDGVVDDVVDAVVDDGAEKDQSR